jgi:hypothetical protein
MREPSDVRRVAAIGGVAAVAIVALLVGKHPFFATTVPEVPPAHATEPQRAEGETSPSLTPIINFSLALVMVARAITPQESARCSPAACLRLGNSVSRQPRLWFEETRFESECVHGDDLAVLAGFASPT